MTGVTTIKQANRDDLAEILKLQKAAFLSEALLVNDLSVQPMTQTPDSLEKEFDRGIILKYTDPESQRIVGSVRAYEESGTAHVRKLIVHPDFQGRGIGKRLLYAIEEYFSGKRLKLFTGVLSEKNQALYRRAGYRPFKQEQVSETLEFLYMEKMVDDGKVS